MLRTQSPPQLSGFASRATRSGARMSLIAVVLLFLLVPSQPSGAARATIAGPQTPASLPLRTSSDGARQANTGSAAQPRSTTAATRAPLTVTGSAQTGSLTRRLSGAELTAVYGHTATLLRDGTVLITGGTSELPKHATYNGVPIANAELYNPATDKVTVLPSLNTRRKNHTATLLPGGKVLIAGGTVSIDAQGYNVSTASTELYDPATRTFTRGLNMRRPRSGHSATLLPNGKVLFIGGFDVELYDPATGRFSIVHSTEAFVSRNRAVLLPNGHVLAADGDIGNIVLYTPTFGLGRPYGYNLGERNDLSVTRLKDGRVLVVGGGFYDWLIKGRATNVMYATDSPTYYSVQPSDLKTGRYDHSAVLLPNGKLLVVSGRINWDTNTPSMELYDANMNTFTYVGNLGYARFGHQTTLLRDGRVLVTGGTMATRRPELVAFVSTNTFTATVTVPNRWITANDPITITASTSGTPLDALMVNNQPWREVRAGTAITTTLRVGDQGSNRRLLIRVRDTSGRVAAPVAIGVDVDMTPPSSRIVALPATSDPVIELRWDGHDSISHGVGYDLQVRDGTDGTWTPVLSNTLKYQTTYRGQEGHRYDFRVRSRDAAGNIEAWPTTYDTFTVVDDVPPSGTLTINGGALTTTTAAVQLSLNASDTRSAVTSLRLSPDGRTWGEWQPYARSLVYTLPDGDGYKRVYVQFRDAPGNVSAASQDMIRLDVAAGTSETLTINTGASWTKRAAVGLVLGAPSGTVALQISNNPSFSGATWQAFNTRPNWTIDGTGSYTQPRVVYVRTRDAVGTVSASYSDSIIYDPVAPQGSIRVTDMTATTVTVALSAQDVDDLSGVTAMWVGASGSTAPVAWEPYTTSKTLARNGTSSTVKVYAKFRDGAGNVSTSVYATASTPSAAP